MKKILLFLIPTPEEVSVHDCNFHYVPEETLTPATMAKVVLVKECLMQMVMICTVKGSYPGNGSYQHCQQTPQNICFDKPAVSAVEVQVPLTRRIPHGVCQPRKKMIPTVQCQDVPHTK